LYSGGIQFGYGAGGPGVGVGGYGAPGGIAIKTISSLVSGTVIACTVGAGGLGSLSGGSGAPLVYGASGASGAIIIEY
jgi:hypothetical protein